MGYSDPLNKIESLKGETDKNELMKEEIDKDLLDFLFNTFYDLNKKIFEIRQGIEPAVKYLRNIHKEWIRINLQYSRIFETFELFQ